MGSKIGLLVTFKLWVTFIYIFIVPGFAWSFVIWPRFTEIHLLLRLIIAVALSITLVPLWEFYASRLLHIGITSVAIFLEIFALDLFAIIILTITRRLKKGT